MHGGGQNGGVKGLVSKLVGGGGHGGGHGGGGHGYEQGYGGHGYPPHAGAAHDAYPPQHGAYPPQHGAYPGHGYVPGAYPSNAAPHGGNLALTEQLVSLTWVGLVHAKIKN